MDKTRLGSRSNCVGLIRRGRPIDCVGPSPGANESDARKRPQGEERSSPVLRQRWLWWVHDLWPRGQRSQRMDPIGSTRRLTKCQWPVVPQEVITCQPRDDGSAEGRFGEGKGGVGGRGGSLSASISCLERRRNYYLTATGSSSASCWLEGHRHTGRSSVWKSSTTIAIDIITSK